MTDSIRPNNSDLIDGLRRFQEEFNRDFTHRDVLKDLRIPKDNFKWIKERNEERESDLIDRLFFYYIYMKKDVWPFVKTLENSYKWLYDYIIRSKNDKWISDYRRAIEDIPNNDWNVHRTKYLWEIQQNLKTLTRGNFLILFGKLGFGKRWLAADACRDYAIISRMNFKIYWLNVSKCNTFELILDKLHRLKVLLQDDDLDIKYNAYTGSTKNEIIHLRGHLRKILDKPAYRDCLIVLTDVQDENIVKAFDLKCKILITTRHMEKLEEWNDRQKIIEIKTGFTLDESTELFLKAMRIDSVSDLPPDLTKFIDEIHEKCSGHPFTMSLIAKTFQNVQENHDVRATRIKNWKENIENHKLEDDCKKIQMSLNETLQFLNANQLECYKKMVIFTDNIDVPLEVLSKLWGIDQQRTESMIEKFHKYSLIERQRNENETCSLHYVHYKYLKNEVDEKVQQDYHQLMLDQYKVEEIFNNRDELELNFPNDRYFHFFIGYHIHGAKRTDLFDVYLDFGFLEEKIRIAKLPNTLGDLMKFYNEIKEREHHHRGYLNELLTFLPTIEHLLFKSRDITLLQYALTNEGVVKEAAQEQAKKFTNRVWLDDVNHLESQNQIVEIQADANPRIVRFVDPGESLVCLISLQDNNILLHDIAADYNSRPTLYRNELPHSTITEMQIFRNQAFLVLNDTGKLSVYNLKRNSARRPSAPINYSTNDATIDKLPFVMDNRDDKFTCFNVFEQQEASNVDLIVGTAKGIIKFYKWLPKFNKFEDNKTDIRTRFDSLFRMANVDEYVMLLNSKGDFRFVNLVNSGMLATNIRLPQQENPLNLHQGFCRRRKVPITICVAARKVIQITHEAVRSFPDTALIKIECDNIFMASEEFDDNKILSSAMSKDGDYIILGTTNGIMVIDRIEKKIICRRNISDHVTSLDVYRYPDEALYIFVSVVKDAEKMINLHGFVRSSSNDEWAITQNEMKYLVGDDLFDIKQNNDEWKLVAVDTKRNVHIKSCNDNFNESIHTVPFKYQIKKLCFYNSATLIAGCTNGNVYKIDLNAFVDEEILKMTGEITYMEHFDQIVIISTNNNYKIIEMTKNSSNLSVIEDQDGKATKAYKIEENFLLIIMKNCSIVLVDLKQKRVSRILKLLEGDNTCVAQSYCNSLLAIATVKRNIHLWEIPKNINGEFKEKSIEGQINDDISHIAISPEKNILAIGCFNGNIEIFDLQQLIPIDTLESHKRPIMNLQFAPWRENEGHLILLSLSESINFWNITHILNNKMGMKRVESAPTRISSRFKSPLKIVPIDTSLENSLKTLSIKKEKNWSNKTGSFEKRELLSCIKFIGKSAKKVVINDDFTRFVTIDNEGNVYHLRMIDQSNDDQQVTIDYNGNPIMRSLE